MYPANPQNLDTFWMNSRRMARVQYTEMVGFRLLMSGVVSLLSDSDWLKGAHHIHHRVPAWLTVLYEQSSVRNGSSKP